MSCLADGILRAQIDGELNGAEAQETAQHLAACADCRRRAEALARQAEAVAAMLVPLAPREGEAPSDARFAYARFRARQSAAESAPSLLGRLFAPRLRPAWAAALAALVVTGLSFTPARSWAQRILAMLRVQKIAVVEVNRLALPGLESNRQAGEALGRFLSDHVVVTMNPGKPQAVGSAEQASGLAGFRVRLPAGRADTPVLNVQGELAFHMTVDRERLEGLLEEAGRPDLNLPASLDGAMIAVHIPKSVTAQYGNCPRGEQHGQLTPQQMAELNGCVLFMQVPSPTVSVPTELNIAELAETALQLTGMSAQDARAFCQTVDWTSTLVLPIPVQDASYQTEPVDGVQGTLISTLQMGNWRPAAYSLLWVKDGVIYSLFGFGNPEPGLALAATLN